MTEIWLRYLLAFGFAYSIFICLLWGWLRVRQDEFSGTFDGFSFGIGGNSDHVASGSANLVGNGGSFDGGGASANFESAVMPDSQATAADFSAVGDLASSFSDGDEIIVPILVIVLVALFSCALAVAAGFIIYSAPLLFAELMFDGVVAVGLYRRLGSAASRHWLESALQRTFLPFLAGALFITAFGWAISHFVPNAVSVADLLALLGAKSH